MDAKLLSSLMDPAILFFFFGLFAGTIRSNLEIPPAIAKFLSLYLLLVIGFKGGVSMAMTGFTSSTLSKDSNLNFLINLDRTVFSSMRANFC